MMLISINAWNKMDKKEKKILEYREEKKGNIILRKKIKGIWHMAILNKNRYLNGGYKNVRN